jgi:LPS sulfotransferase NodH
MKLPSLRTKAGLAPPLDWVPPTQGYVICSLPRSGSNILCDLLRQTRIAGRPRELLHETAKTALPRPAAEWMAALRQAGSTPNGVFAIKLFPPHLARLENEQRLQLFAWFPGLVFVLLRRRDLLAQAVSLALATQTGRWVAQDRPTAAPRYDAQQIGRMLDHLVEWESYWRRRFAVTGVTPLELFYEDFAPDPASGANAILERLGLPQLTGATRGSGWLRTQTDAVNAEWRERFAAELAAHGFRLADRPSRARPSLLWLRAWLTGRLVLPPFRLGQGD